MAREKINPKHVKRFAKEYIHYLKKNTISQLNKHIFLVHTQKANSENGAI